MKAEQNLKARGYHLADSTQYGKTKADAQAYAAKLRAEGRKACVVTYSTYIRGYHEYGVWTK